MQRKTAQYELTFGALDEPQTPESDDSEDVVPDCKLVCALTGEFKKESDAQRIPQSLMEWLRRDAIRILEEEVLSPWLS
jgi:hypothetical protein